uniref:Uncharacterized protein n=1 Tax=Romanomermis culicivorax TaxID=13658 RepID=A0A915L8K1_ROMCU
MRPTSSPCMDIGAIQQWTQSPQI